METEANTAHPDILETGKKRHGGLERNGPGISR
jgi:hypothetical protein